MPCPLTLTMKLKIGKQIPYAANKLAVVMGGDEEFFMKTGGDDRFGSNTQNCDVTIVDIVLSDAQRAQIAKIAREKALLRMTAEQWATARAAADSPLRADIEMIGRADPLPNKEGSL